MTQRTPDRLTVSILDWDPSDAGFVILSNYWLRFWRPYLGLKAAALYEQILAFAHGDDDDECYPSMATLSDALGIDRRSIYGWPKRDGSGEREKGLLQVLRDERLLTYDRRDDGWHFSIVKRAPILHDDQVAQLRHPLQEQHRRWLERNAPTAIQNVRSMVATTPANKRSMVTTTPPLLTTTPPLLATTPTIPITNTHQQREIAAGVVQAWHAAVFMALADTRDTLVINSLRSLRPLGVEAGTLTLAAPTAYNASKWQRRPELLSWLARLIPAESIAAVVVVGPADE